MKRITLLLVLALTVPAVGQVDEIDENMVKQGHQAIVKLSGELIGEMAKEGRLSPKTAARVVERLSSTAARLPELPDLIQKSYCRAMAQGAAVTGDVSLAVQSAEGWRQLEPGNPLILRSLLFLHFLAGNPDGADDALRSLAQPEFAKWRHWVLYMKSLLPLVGARPTVFLLPLSNGGSLDLPDPKGRVVVLDFWVAGPAGGGDSPSTRSLRRQAKLVRMYKGKPVLVVGINLDAAGNVPHAKTQLKAAKSKVPQFFHAEHPRSAIVPEPFSVTAVPSACVIAQDGAVVFAGDPRTSELHSAISCAVASPTSPAPRGSTRRPGARQRGRVGPPVPPPSARELGLPPPLAPLAGPGMMPGYPPGLMMGPQRQATQAEQKAAQKLYDEGMDKIRLGKKANSPTFRKEGLKLLTDCSRRYSFTKAGREAMKQLRAERR